MMENTGIFIRYLRDVIFPLSYSRKENFWGGQQGRFARPCYKRSLLRRGMWASPLSEASPQPSLAGGALLSVGFEGCWVVTLLGFLPVTETLLTKRHNFIVQTFCSFASCSDNSKVFIYGDDFLSRWINKITAQKEYLISFNFWFLKYTETPIVIIHVEDYL